MGDAELFEDDQLPYVEALTATARGMTRSAADAEDLVQETYLKAYRSRRAFTAGTNAKAWLTRIMTNLYIDRYRRARRGPEEVDVAEVDELAVYRQLANEVGTPEAELLANLPDEEVRAALAALPDGYREVVVLADIDGMSYREIAEQLEVPLGTVMSRLHRARRALERDLGAYAFQHGLTEHPPVPVEISGRRDRMGRDGKPLPIECVALIDEVQGFLDGELDAEETEVLHRHVDECAACFKMASFKRDVRRLVADRVVRADGNDVLAVRIRGAMAALEAEGG